MNKKEKDYFKDLINEGYNFIARDLYGLLKAFEKKPSREINFYYSNGKEKVIDGLLLPELCFRNGVLKITDITKGKNNEKY